MTPNSGQTGRAHMLANHDHRKQVAVVRDQDGKRFVEFLGDTRITKEAFFEIFGGDCFNVLELTEEAGDYCRERSR